MERDPEGRRARDLIRRATHLAEAAPAAPGTTSHRARHARLEVELAREEVETKLLKRERCRRTRRAADRELEDACARLGSALARLAPRPPHETRTTPNERRHP
ncbi:MAG: hypothetical protein H6828_15690 [Planctomycetes bacterium]|nr:hypothetical protein [Planctomycetota bacterium]